MNNTDIFEQINDMIYTADLSVEKYGLNEFVILYNNYISSMNPKTTEKDLIVSLKKARLHLKPLKAQGNAVASKLLQYINSLEASHIIPESKSVKKKRKRSLSKVPYAFTYLNTRDFENELNYGFDDFSGISEKRIVRLFNNLKNLTEKDNLEGQPVEYIMSTIKQNIEKIKSLKEDIDIPKQQFVDLIIEKIHNTKTEVVPKFKKSKK